MAQKSGAGLGVADVSWMVTSAVDGVDLDSFETC